MRNIFKRKECKQDFHSDIESAVSNPIKECTNCSGFVPGGHFYSPIPNLEEIKESEDQIFNYNTKEIKGVDLNVDTQLNYLNKIIEFYPDLPFEDEQKEGLRYKFENGSYSYSDAIFLYGMIRNLKPSKIIEVGCGFSSCVILDTNELFFDNSINTTFIEPYPDLLYSLIKSTDLDRIMVIPKKLQTVDLNIFKTLNEGDILFIDSTHVSRAGSDVNYLFFEMLPSLNKGVHVHFHDVFYPFEYPKEWIYSGRAWNEDYLLRAFLQYNNTFEIVAFNTFLEIFYQEIFENKLPLCLKNLGGSIWIKKVL